MNTTMVMTPPIIVATNYVGHELFVTVILLLLPVIRVLDNNITGISNSITLWVNPFPLLSSGSSTGRNHDYSIDHGSNGDNI